MKYNFLADSIDIGIDDAEEVYTITFTDTGEVGDGPADNYLLFQRSVAGIGDDDFIEPYIELNDPANGRFADSVEAAELLPNYLHLQIKADSHITSHPGVSADDITDLVVRFDADGPKLRKLKYGLELLVSNGFPLRSIG